MLPNNQPLDVAWFTAEGKRESLNTTGPRLEVTAGVLIDFAFRSQEPTRVEIDLTLSGERPVCGGLGTSNARFVIIPLDESSLLLGVAEPSAEPALLMPVPSTPVLLVAGGRRTPTQGGLLKVRTSEDVGADLDFLPSVGEVNACVLRIQDAPGGRDSSPRSRLSRGISLQRFSEDSVAVVVGPR